MNAQDDQSFTVRWFPLADVWSTCTLCDKKIEEDPAIQVICPCSTESINCEEFIHRACLEQVMNRWSDFLTQKETE